MITANGTQVLTQPSLIEVQFAPGVKRDILSLSARSTYSLILEETDHEPTAFRTWQRGVEEVEISSKEGWGRACTEVYRLTRVTKLQSFQYKILHRTIPCNVYLKQIRIKDSDWCPFCDESDTITDFIFSCSNVQPFWEAICAWFRQADDLYLD